MISINDLNFLKKCGFHLTAINPETKKPVDKNGYGKWVEWEPEEIIKHNKERAGYYHDRFNDDEDFCFLDVDFDDKSLLANQLMSMLPVTLTVGKKPNGSAAIETHATFKIPKELKPNKDFELFDSKGNKIIEVLRSTCTWAIGHNRHIIRKKDPVMLDADGIQSLFKQLKIINLITELRKNWPKEGKRDEAYLRLNGALTRDTDLTTFEKENVTETLCGLTNDPEVKNRRDKVKYQEKQFKENPEQVAGIKSLCAALNVPTLKSFDYLKREGVSKPIATGLTFLNGHEFTIKDFPKPEYVLHPIVAKQQIRQVFAKAGTGKTLMMLHEACAVASGYDFLNYKHSGKKTPILYVEGEMDSSSIQKRLNDIEDAYEMEGKTLNKEFIFFATLAIQKNMHFESLTKDDGRLNVEISAQEIEKITGIKPVIYLDNITALTVMQEKEGAEWIELMHWLSRLRNKGYHVTFLHHPTKTGQTASGSNIKERSIDIDMKLTTPDENTLVVEYEENHTQMSIEFLKWREHMNTFHSKKRIAIINRTTGKWLIVPMLSQTQRKIWKLLDKGKTPEQIIESAKGKDGKVQEGMSKPNVYKVVKILKQEGVIKDDKPSK